MVGEPRSVISTSILQLTGGFVVGGPFKGMAYGFGAAHSVQIPKQLGLHDQELHTALERLLRRPYKRVINIGCEDGYYAVGLALRLPRAQVYTFDSDSQSRELCSALAAANGVEKRVHVREACTRDALTKLLKPGTLIVCDCEGCEVDLLQPELLPVLSACDLLVEQYANNARNTFGNVLPRFCFSHAIQVIAAVGRTAVDFDRVIAPLLESGGDAPAAKLLRDLTPDHKRMALAEIRHSDMRWACLSAVPIPSPPPSGVSRSRKATRSPASPLITGCILAWNEERNIEAAIDSLRRCADEIIIIDNGSDDDTAAIAIRCGARVLTAPRGNGNFDGARNLVIEEAKADWIMFQDADERIPERLAATLRLMVEKSGDSFEAIQAPFKTYFCGQWMQHCGWWPGYTRSQLLKKGAFRYGERLHSGLEIDGRVRMLPYDNPDYRIDHFSYDDISSWIEKINRYTLGEAKNLLEDGLSHGWQPQMASLLADWSSYYDRGHGAADGVPGFILSFCSGMYKFLIRAKLWDLRRRSGQAREDESVPGSVAEVLEFWASCFREGVDPWLIVRHEHGRPQAKEIPEHWLAPTAAADAPVLPPKGRAGIAACIFARNEEGRIEPALRSLRGWVDKLIVVENGSTDGTAAIARKYADVVLTAPPAASLEMVRARIADELHEIAFADGDWLLFLDADERIPAALGEQVRRLVAEHGHQFDALCLPMKNIYYGKWMQSLVWWPGDFGPRLMKKGTFAYDERIHTGLLTQGRMFRLPAADPDLAIVHEAYEDINQYVERLNRYTDEHARAMDAAGLRPTWRNMLGHYLEDWHVHYDRLQAREDGMHGHVQSVLCGFYRFVVMAKVWDIRRKRGEPANADPLPQSTQEMLVFMAQVLQQLSPQTAPPPAPSVRAALVQTACGEHEQLLDLTRAHHGEYARRHGMEYICRYGPQQTGRSPLWDKIPVLIEILREGNFEYICWLDADTLIVDRSRDLRDALPPDAWLGMVQHGSPPYFNNGVMLVRSTPQALAFLEEVWATWPVDSGWEDNAAVLRVLGSAPEKWRGVAVLDDAWNSTVRQNESPAPVVIGWHGLGGTQDRLLGMMHVFQQALARERESKQPDPEPRPAPGPPLCPNANTVPIDPVPAVSFQAALGRPLRVKWYGDQTLLSSLALVNRELCLEMLGHGDVELSLEEPGTLWHDITEKDDPRFGPLFARIGAELSGPPDVTIRHAYPQDWRLPETGKLIIIAPWELSHLPNFDWVDGANQAHEIWVPSRTVRDIYVRSGVAAEKVKVIPNGVRSEVFTPEGPRYDLPTKKGTRFLFVGGTVFRKGPDLLLKAYGEAFRRADDVCLVFKDMGTRTFYQGATATEAIRRMQNDPAAPEIIYLDQDMSEEALVSLNRSCTCAVLPSRGEGFGIPPLEAMACGLPAIVTAGGATDDFVDDQCGLRVPARRVPRVGAFQRDKRPLPVDPWELETDHDALVAALRWVYEHPEGAAARGALGRLRAEAGWSWKRAADMARVRLKALAAPGPPRQPASPRRWRAPGSGPAVKRSRKRVKLSLCMIVRDEEERIEACLASISPYVDEMIVVDSGSTDRTRELAAAMGAQVYDYPWTDSFADARNQSISLARGDYIFWMDADDTISPEEGAKLRELVRKHPNQDAAYQVQVHIPPGPGEYSFNVVDHVKFFPRLPDVVFEHAIHEQVLPSLRRAGINILPSDLHVTHTHYDRSPEGQKKKRIRDFHLLELDLLANPDHPFTLFNYGMTYLFATKEFEVAAHYLRRSLDRSHWQDSIVRKAYALLTAARICRFEWHAALAANEEGRRNYPEDGELLYQAGQIYRSLGRLPEAQSALERLVAGQDDATYRSVDTALRSYRGSHELAQVARAMGDRAAEERILRDIRDNHPEYLPAALDLTEVLIANGKRSEAVILLDALSGKAAIDMEVARLRDLLRAQT